MGTNEYIFVAVLLGVPAIAGFMLARSRAKNPVMWGLFSAVFPFCIFVLWFNKPEIEVQGHFRKCSSCGEIYKWKLPACKFCGAGHD